MEARAEYVLITGASERVGEAVARELAPGARLILQGDNASAPEAVRVGLSAAEAHLVWAQDLGLVEEAGSKLAALLGDSGALVTSFVHCVPEGQASPLDKCDPATVLRRFQASYFAASAIVRTLVRRNVNHGALRSVVFVGGIAGRFGAAGGGLDGAVNGALESLGRSLAAELAPIRVNTILSGGIGEAGSGYLLGAGRAEDVAAMAGFLISDRARWITGQQLVVDGGKTAH
jgi:NAD(P)-dependent dehydrogenase (short-subunit alcohol dehydrogenase family)